MEHFIEAKKWVKQKSVLLLLMILMPLLSAGSMEISTMRIVHPAWAFNSGLDILGMIILLLVYMSVIKDREDRSRRTGFFAWLCFFTSLAMFLDQAFWVIYTQKSMQAVAFAVDELIFLISIASVTSFWFYLTEVSESDDPRLERASILINRAQGIAILLVLGNIFFHYAFTVDTSAVIVYEKYAFLLYIYPLAVMGLALVLILRLNVDLQKKKILISFVSLPLIALLLQLFTSTEYSLQYPAVVCSIVLIYGNVFAERSADLQRKQNQLLVKENELLVSQKEQARLNTELDLASQIQQHFLPMVFPPYPAIKELDLYAVMKPAKEVGGDFYDFYLVDKDHLAVVIADVSGKGIPAALMMMITKIMIKNAVNNGLSPAEVFNSVNQQLCDNNDADMFVTAWLGIVSLRTGEVVAANAGHEYPAFRSSGNSFELVRDKHDLVLGGMEITQYNEYTFTLNKEDTLFIYTDGVAEAENDAHEFFGTDRMLEALNKAAGKDAKTLIDTVDQSIQEFVDEAAQFDDITMLALRLHSR